MARQKVVIVGGGFGGLNAAQALKNAPFDILIIDKTNHHLFQPLLYQVASAALSPGEIAIPIREILRKQDNATVIMGDVERVDRKQKQLLLANGEMISYDYLILAVGARHSYFGNNGWEVHAPGLKTIQDALKIREAILLSFEKAERLDNPAEAEKYLNFVIIGGGPTGVEMAGAIAEIAHKTLFKNFRRIHPERSKIYLIEAGPRILPMYPSPLSARARSDLERLGVCVKEGKKVTRITAEGVQVEEEFYPCKNKIWAAGNEAGTVLKTLDTPLDRQGRVIVEPDLSVPGFRGFPEIFVIGDAACTLDSREGDKGLGQKPLPGIAPVAIQQGKYVASLLRSAALKGFQSTAPRRPFRYFDKGSMATIGKAKAIATVGSWQFKGVVAWLMWCFIHIVYLIGFRNRLNVMLEWTLFYLTGQRGARLIYQPIEKPSSKETS